jgi:hypothetical protein
MQFMNDENQTASKPTSSERIHHPYSPSTLQPREACPCYEGHHGTTNDMAEMGTRQHDAVDSRLDDPKLPDYRAAAVVDCISFAQDRLKAFPGGKMLTEQYLPIDDRAIRNPNYKEGSLEPEWFLGTTAGYVDKAIISADETEAEVIDWKFGNNAVEEASNNLQGIAYALGLLKKFPTLLRITVRFIMPHLDYTTEHTFVKADFDSLMVRVRTVVARAIEARKKADDFSQANPNVSSCLFCSRIGQCPAVAAVALKLGKKYRPLEIPENVTPSTIKDPKQAGLGIRLAAIMATWAEAYRRQATGLTISDPDFIPEGYTLVESQRRIVKVAKGLGETAKEFIPTEHHHLVDALFDVPIGELEKLVSTFAPRGQKEKSVEKFGARALEKGALELGKPFAFLRQSRVQEGDTKGAKN